MRREGVRALEPGERGTAVRDFDVLGFTLQYEMTYTNVLNMLDLGGIPVCARDRSDERPDRDRRRQRRVQPGAAGAVHRRVRARRRRRRGHRAGRPVREWKRAGTPRAGAAARPAARCPASTCRRSTKRATTRTATSPGSSRIVPDAPATIRRRIVETLPPALVKPIVPFLQTVHDRAAVEIQRGCTQGCRFCQAGMIYRPTRERSPEEVVEAARAADGEHGLRRALAALAEHDRPQPDRADGQAADGDLPGPEGRHPEHARR